MANITQTQNPFLTQEMIDYLTSQGYYNTSNVVGATLFKKADKGIFIQGTVIRLRFYDGLTLESSFEDPFALEGLNNITLDYFKRFLEAFHFTNSQKERHLIVRGRKSDVMEALRMLAGRTAVVIFIIICFCSCSYHQELYRQPGHFTYENNHYRFHADDTLIYVDPLQADTSKLFWRTIIFNVRGKEHINYVNN